MAQCSYDSTFFVRQYVDKRKKKKLNEKERYFYQSERTRSLEV